MLLRRLSRTFTTVWHNIWTSVVSPFSTHLPDYHYREEHISVGLQIVDVTSPFYPLYYPNNVEWSWYITSDLTAGTSIVITFLAISLHPGDDFLTIGIGDTIVDSSVVLRLTGFEAPRIATFGNSSLWIRFTTNEDGQLTKGFWLQLTSHDHFGNYQFLTY